ncbi:MAG: elongation factor G [Myxococcota bacterium]
MVDLSKTRNIGISAHIDSGKTTLTERILFYTGRIHKIVEVKDKSGGGATMDSMELERERGITIQSAATHVTWGEHHINIIDTPGHVDFTVEVERALSVLDGAILVLCGSSGVQSQSITVDRQMRRYKVPRIAFINKMDRAGADAYRVTGQLQDKLKHKPVMVTIPIGAEDEFEGVIDLRTREAVYFEGDNGENLRRTTDLPDGYAEKVEEYRSKLIEVAADYDEELMEKFLEEDIEDVTVEQINAAIRKGCISLDITPVFCGSAYKNKGVQIAVDAVVEYLPNPTEVTNMAFEIGKDKSETEVELATDDSKHLCALAFKLEQGRYGQLTYLRIYQGQVNKGDMVYNTRTGQKIKLGRIVRMHSDDMEDIEQAGSGDIIAMFGVDCAAGDTFHGPDQKYSLRSMFVPDPVIRYSVEPKDKSAQTNFSKALNRFSKEDPTFRVHRDEESAETIIAGMGELHLEVYIERMKREYNVDTIVGEPQVAYRETISREIPYTYTHKKQTGGSGQFAKVAGVMRPLVDAEQGVHYRFVNKITGGTIPREYIPSCDSGFQDGMERGVVIGFPVVDVEMELNDGSFHAVDSSDMAFKLCARQAFKEAMRTAGPVVLEPLMKVVVETPEEFQGAVQTTLIRRRGMIQGSETAYGTTAIEANVPLSEMFGYSTELRSSTQGKAEYTMEFAKYGEVPSNIQKELIEKYKDRQK